MVNLLHAKSSVLVRFGGFLVGSAFLIMGCMSASADIVVYKYSAKQLSYEYDMRWEKWLDKDTNYLLLDTDTGEFIRIEYSNRKPKSYEVMDDGEQFNLTEVTLSKQDVWVLSKFSEFDGYFMEGKASDMKLGGAYRVFPKSLSGFWAYHVNMYDYEELGIRTVKLRMDKKLSLITVNNDYDMEESIDAVVDYLEDKGYVEFD